jgi:hypothetical protein
MNQEKAAQEIIKSLAEEGYDKGQIADAMCDGEYLGSQGITKSLAEKVYDLCRTGGVYGNR